MTNKNRMPNLTRQLPKVKSDGSNVSRLLAPVSTSTTSKAASGTGTRPGASRDTTTAAISSSGPKVTAINFGKAPSSATKSTVSAGTNWGGVLKNVASGGIGSAFGGGLLSAIGGLGGLVSGIAGLFGGSKAPTPLTAFQLPTAEQQTASISRNAGGPQLGIAGNSITGAAVGGVYGNSHNQASVGTAVSGSQSQQVAQAVKQALLTSSSLNDVIAEI